MYAPNHALAHVEFWVQIVDSIPLVGAWCMGGDFNMLESLDDRKGGSLTTTHGAELAAWERLCFHCGFLIHGFILALFSREIAFFPPQRADWRCKSITS